MGTMADQIGCMRSERDGIAHVCDWVEDTFGNELQRLGTWDYSEAPGKDHNTLRELDLWAGRKTSKRGYVMS